MISPLTSPPVRPLPAQFGAISKKLLFSPELIGKKLADHYIYQSLLVTHEPIKLFDASYDGADNYKPPLYMLIGRKLDQRQRPTAQEIYTYFENDHGSTLAQFDVIA